MSRIITTLRSEGFTSVIEEMEDGRVRFIADLDIDADGANGQNGARPAYMVGNKGTEHLANGGMGMRGGKVVGINSWFKDIVILDKHGNPREFPGGIIASKTAYRFPDKSPDDPAAYLDAETVPYIVVPPIIIQSVAGAVKGCRARATNLRNSKVVDAVMGDVGPRTKNGEGSMALARLLGLRFSPRNGGEDRPFIVYELWPGEFGEIDGKKIPLQRSNGKYIFPPELNRSTASREIEREITEQKRVGGLLR